MVTALNYFTQPLCHMPCQLCLMDSVSLLIEGPAGGPGGLGAKENGREVAGSWWGGRRRRKK